MVSLKSRHYVYDVMTSGQILESTKSDVLVIKDAFSLYLVVQAPQLIRSSMSPTGLVDPGETRWSMEFDTHVSFVCTNDLYCLVLPTRVKYFVAPT